MNSKIEDLARIFEQRVAADLRATFVDIERSFLVAGGPSVVLASLPRRLGREALFGDHSAPTVRRLRVCDAAAALLFSRAGLSSSTLGELFAAGDAEERRMILASLGLLDLAPEVALARLLIAAHRSNDQVLFETGVLDQDLPARVLGDNDFDNIVLKVAFLGLPLARLPGATARARPELSRKLLDFAAEREAAGRPVWADGLELASFAPIPELSSWIVRDLVHADPARRLAAARAARRLADPEILGAVAVRRLEEPDSHIRRLLEPDGSQPAP